MTNRDNFEPPSHSSPRLTLVEPTDVSVEFLNEVFLPTENYEDFAIPTTEYRGKEQIGGATVNFTVEVPKEIIDPHPVVYAHGYCARAYDELRGAAARNGKVAITFDTPRGHHKLAGLNLNIFLRPSACWLKQFTALCEAPGEWQKKLGWLPRIDLSGHSMGGRSVTHAALKHPELVRTVILNQAPGLYDHTALQLAERIPAFGLKEFIPGILPGQHRNITEFAGITRGSLYYICRNPLKTAVEGISIGNCDIRPAIKQLGTLGIKTAIMVGQAEKFISAEKTREASIEAADLFVTYSDPRADHLAIHRLPLMVAKAHEQTLHRLHDKPKLSLVDSAA